MRNELELISNNFIKYIAKFSSLEEKRNMDGFIVSLLDFNVKEFLFLSEEEIEMIRIRFGFNNNGEIVTPKKMAVIYNKSEKEIKHELEILYRKISIIIQYGYKIDSLDRMSSLSVCSNCNEYKNKSIISIVDDLPIIIALCRLGKIYTVNDLLSYSLEEIKSIQGIGEKYFNLLKDIVHKKGFKFIDELSIGERKNVILSSSVEVIDNSSIYWLSFELKDIDFINKNQISTIGDLKSYIGKCDIPFSVTYKCLMYGIFNVKLKNSIILLNLSNKVINLFYSNNIYSIYDLINKSIYEVQVILELNSYLFDEVTNSLNMLGLKLIDSNYLDDSDIVNRSSFSRARVERR